MDAGVGVREIADAFGMSRSTVYRWRALAGRRAGERPGHDAATGGPAGRGGGAPAAEPAPRARPETSAAVRRLSPGQRAALRERLLGEPTPEGRTPGEDGDATGATGSRGPLWTIEHVREVLARDLGVPATAADAGAVLRALGLWPDRPPRRPHRIADPGWVASSLPRIRERAEAEGALLFFVEDVLVGDGELWLLTAAPVTGACRFAVYDPAREGGDDHLRFLRDFLDRLGRETGTPVYVVLEPLPAEEARAVARLASASGDRLRVFFLPDVLVRLERLAGRWREALAATRERAAARDEAGRGYRAARSAEERLRLDRDRAIRACRDAGVPITTVVSHTGLAAKTIYDALGRTAGSEADVVPASAAVRRERLDRLDEAVGAWRAAAAAMREAARAREAAVAAYRAAKAVEERLRRRRDDAIVAWRATGIAAGVIAARTGLSGGLISQITGRRAPAEGEERHGETGRLLDELERAGERWRRAVAAVEERARARADAAAACRAGRAVEERLRGLRDQVITACQAAAVPIPDIALCAGLDVTTVYQMLHANRFAPGDVLRADRVRLMSRLREVSARWRQAAEAVRGYVRARDEATRAWRQSRAAEREARRLRDKAIVECRAAGIAVSLIAFYAHLDLSTIYGVCQVPSA